MKKDFSSHCSEYVDFVISNLYDWKVDSIVDFGSHAKGEAVEGSDHDLAVYLHSDEKLFLPNFIRESKWFDDFMSRYSGLPFESTDLSSILRKKWQDEKRVGSPIAPWGPWDIRWFIYRLAFETEGGNFLQLVCSHSIYDRGWYEGLIRIMQKEMPFHWNEGEESGIIDALKRWCYAERDAMRNELDKIHKGEKVGEYRKIPWIYPAAYSISHSIATLAFVEEGWLVWHKQAILKRVEERFSKHFDSFTKAYEYKSTTFGRRRFARLLTQQSTRLLNELELLTCDLSSLCSMIWTEIDLALKSENSKIPRNIPQWKERNDEIYTKFLLEYFKDR